MLVIRPKSPDHALALSITMLNTNGRISQSRNGPVVRFDQPVTTVWSDPTNRVLWSPTRDCNPFLHFIESAWMLAGRNDVPTVAKLAANMASYSDDQTTLHGAYGYRWRQYFGYDQINLIIKELRANPESRRCVLQMWDGAVDLEQATTGGKDVPCNTAIYFDSLDGRLNMTVSNRSNDAVWGCYGANLVHMSILHEYVAYQVGQALGTYYQVSNNLHFYTDNPVTRRLIDFQIDETRERGFSLLLNYDSSDKGRPARVSKEGGEVLFHSDDQDLLGTHLPDTLNFMIDEWLQGKILGQHDNDPHFVSVLSLLMDAFTHYKNSGPATAVEFLELHALIHSQWVLAATEWLKRRPSYKAVE